MAWKPHKMTAETIEELKKAFANSFTDVEASLYVWIAPRTLYDYCSKYPDFAELKETLKHKPNIKAKLNKIKAIWEGNLQESGWWLERKSKDEFSTKVVGENTNKNLNIEVEESEELNNLLKDNKLI